MVIRAYLIVTAVLIAAAILWLATANAADAPADTPPVSSPVAPHFVPFTISQQEYAALEQRLGAFPYSDIAPIMQFLANKEAQAQADAAKPPPKK